MENTDFYKKLQQDAESIANEAGQILVGQQSKAKIVHYKDEADFVTDADLESEKYIISEIRKKYPGHAISSEEAGSSGSSDFNWIIDPLDGTKEFAKGLTEFNCLIAVEHKNKLVVGVIRRIGIDDLYSCSLGNGAKLNGKFTNVSGLSDLSKAFIGFHIPTKANSVNAVHLGMTVMEKLIFSSYRVRPGWDDAKLLGWVARGVLDAHIVCANVNKWHDLAAGILLVQEAGGKVTDWVGKDVTKSNYTKPIVASNGKIHDKLLSLINNYAK